MTMNSATKVLLAQAVYAVGTNDWTKVINLVNTSKEIGANLVNEKDCQKAFEEVLKNLTGPTSVPNQHLEPNSSTAKKLVNQVYSDRLQELVASIKANKVKQIEIASQIARVASGSLDDTLISHVPASARHRYVTSAPIATTSELDPISVGGKASGSAKKTRKAKQEEMENEAIDLDAEVEMDVDEGEAEGEAEGEEDEAVVEELLLKGSKPTPSEEVPDSEEITPTTTVKEKKKKGGFGSRPEAITKRSLRGSKIEENTTEAEETDDAEDDETNADETNEDEEEEEEEEEEDGEVETKEEGSTAGRGRRRGAAKRTTSKRKAESTNDAASATSDKLRKRQETDVSVDKDEKLAAARFKKGMNGVLKTLTDSPHAGPFQTPVRKSEAPGYSLAVKRPLCFRDVVRGIKEGTLTTTDEVLRDVLLIFANAVQFNEAGEDVVEKARELAGAFEAQLELFLATQQSAE